MAPLLTTVLLESMVTIGTVADLNVMLAPALMVMLPSTLVLCEVVSDVLIVVSARAGPQSSASAAAESMRVRLFKSNLL